jgi:hypothetical protein
MASCCGALLPRRRHVCWWQAPNLQMPQYLPKSALHIAGMDKKAWRSFSPNFMLRSRLPTVAAILRTPATNYAINACQTHPGKPRTEAVNTGDAPGPVVEARATRRTQISGGGNLSFSHYSWPICMLLAGCPWVSSGDPGLRAMDGGASGFIPACSPNRMRRGLGVRVGITPWLRSSEFVEIRPSSHWGNRTRSEVGEESEGSVDWGQARTAESVGARRGIRGWLTTAASHAWSLMKSARSDGSSVSVGACASSESPDSTAVLLRKKPPPRITASGCNWIWINRDLVHASHELSQGKGITLSKGAHAAVPNSGA